MKQLVILSGKGGTGKTTIAGAFIKLVKNKAFADCDVDAPNLHLIYTEHKRVNKSDFYGLKKAYKDDKSCINCGKCEELCKFNAIKNGILNPNECEGCGVCEAFCPSMAQDGKPSIRLVDNIAGESELLNVNGEMFSTAQLKMGNGASGKLVTEVRKNLTQSIKQEKLIIIDGSPGIGCPVIASVTGVDLVLIVAEPTLSGIHDMKRIIETTKRFGIDCVVCINKYDVNENNTKDIEKYCKNENVSVLGRIPFDEQVVKAVNNKKSIVDYPDSKAGKAILAIWERISNTFLEDRAI